MCEEYVTWLLVSCFVVIATHSYATSRHFTQWHWLHAMQVMRYHIVTEVPDPCHELFNLMYRYLEVWNHIYIDPMYSCIYAIIYILYH